MKIINITPGIIPIPPNGWGAVEKIIWENHTNLLKLGHDSQITYLDDVPSDADVVHIHVANLALMAKERGIPYYFTMHDHHSYLNGKDSFTYKENLEAMKGAIRSFVPAKYLVDYFEGIPEYFSHGVNTEYFAPEAKLEHRLLCVANNGYAHDQTIDRKGFGIAIEAARALNLPITIAGPSNNKHYFEKYPPTYNKLTILYDLDEKQLLTEYRNHTIFIHPSELEAGHPNLTLLEALSCGLPIVGTLEPATHLDGMLVTSRDTTDVVLGIQEILLRYSMYSELARKQAIELSWANRTKDLLSIYKLHQPTMRNELLKHYNTTKQLNKSLMVKINQHNIDGIFTEILGGIDGVKYDVSFIDTNTNNTVYTVELQRNHWAKPNTKYYVKWKTIVKNKKTNEQTQFDLDLKNKRVLISLESKSLGDTLAWIPYVEEFRKKHQCTVICSTFWNNLFKDEYKEIEFVTPGSTAHNLAALYRIGLFYKDDKIDYDMHPTNPLVGSLQKVASDILGLEYKEVRPRMKQPESIEERQVCIAVHSTAQPKYWNNPTGWQEVVDWLRGRGYTVKLLSQEEDGYMGNKNPTGVIQFPKSSIEDVIGELKKSKAFIGISSGLTWVSWATGIPTVLISGFTDPVNEMEDCIRIAAPKGKCSGCWHRHKFNPGDWNWCPDHKDTPRQFECSKEITAQMVIQELEKIL